MTTDIESAISQNSFYQYAEKQGIKLSHSWIQSGRTQSVRNQIPLLMSHPAPEKDLNTTIIYLHGMQSHQGWFLGTAQHLQKKGHRVVCYDRAGSGLSALLKSEIPKNEISTIKVFYRELETILVNEKKNFSDRKLILWGNSYGGKILMSFLAGIDRYLQIEDQIKDYVKSAKIVLTTPGIVKHPHLKLPFSIFNFLLARPKKMFPTFIKDQNNDQGAHLFVQKSPYRELIQNDNLSRRTFSKREFLESRKMDSIIKKGIPGRISNPTLAIFNPRDLIVDSNRSSLILSKICSNFRYMNMIPKHHTDHFLMFTDQRDLLLREVEEFVLGDG